MTTETKTWGKDFVLPPGDHLLHRWQPDIVQGMAWLTVQQFNSLPVHKRPPPVTMGAKWRCPRNHVVADQAPGSKHDGRLLDAVSGKVITEDERKEREQDGAPDWYLGEYVDNGMRIRWTPIIVRR